MKETKSKVSIKRIDYRYFSGIKRIGGRKPSPDVQTVIESASKLKAKEGFVIENWSLKGRPVVHVRNSIKQGKFSERRLPEVGSFAILRTK